MEEEQKEQLARYMEDATELENQALKEQRGREMAPYLVL